MKQGTFHRTSFTRFLNHQPFKWLEDIHQKEFDLKQKEIENIKSITINDIYTDFPNDVKTILMDQISVLFQGTNGTKTTELVILFTEEYAEDNERLLLLKLIEKWLNEYGQKSKVYELITHGNESSKVFSFRLELRMSGGEKLVQMKVIESNTFREPEILQRITKTDMFTPVYFINIGEFN